MSRNLEFFTCNSSSVIGLIRCGGARDRHGDVFLRLKLGGVIGLGIKVKRRGNRSVQHVASFDVRVTEKKRGPLRSALQ